MSEAKNFQLNTRVKSEMKQQNLVSTSNSVYKKEWTFVWHGMIWHGMIWYGMVWYGMVWYVSMTEAMSCDQIFGSGLNSWTFNWDRHVKSAAMLPDEMYLLRWSS
jgi:hypothetical protein